MPIVDLKFIEDGDACWPELKEKIEEGKVVHTTDTLQIAYLRGGMVSGKGSVTLRYDLPDGRVVLAETSAAAFMAVAMAIKAKEEDLPPLAENRFEVHPDKAVPIAWSMGQVHAMRHARSAHGISRRKRWSFVDCG